MSDTDAETNQIPETPEVGEWKSHAVELKQALYASLQSEVMARRELDEYRVREIEELRGRLSGLAERTQRVSESDGSG